MKIINYHFNPETIEYFYSRSFEIKDANELHKEMSNFIALDYNLIETESLENAVESLVEQVFNYNK